MKTEARNAWVKALRSGEYEQSKHMLHSNVGWCCLGVACDVFAIPLGIKVNKVVFEEEDGNETFETFFNFESQVLPRVVQEYLHLNTPEGSFTEPRITGAQRGDTLTSLNDAGMSFDAIADVLEKHEDLLFSDKKEWEKND